MNDQEHSYQPGFLKMFAPIFLFGAIVGAGFIAALQALGQVGYGVVSYTFLQLLSIVYLWAVVGAFILAKVLAVKMSGDAISGRTFWGKARSIAWSEVSGARPVNAMGVQFLRIYTADGNAPLWVPLFVKKKGEFLSAMRSALPADHPVLEALP